MRNYFIQLVSIIFLFNSCQKEEDTIRQPEVNPNEVRVYFDDVLIIKCVGNTLVFGSLTLIKNIKTSNIEVVFFDQNGRIFDISDNKFDLLVGSGANYLAYCVQDQNNRWLFQVHTSNFTGMTYI